MKKNLFLIIIAALISLCIFGFSIKGQKGNPFYFQKEYDESILGPFEATNSTSRYALTKSIVESNTFFLTDDLAHFSAPDLVEYKGKYFSIFTPGISLMGIPFYILGKQLGIPQLLTFFLTTLFALGNLVLITLIGKRLGLPNAFALLGGLAFSFGTNALAYSNTFTQHHAGTFFLLLGVYIVSYKPTLIKNVLLGILFGLGILADIPNLFLFLPILFYSLSRHFESKQLEKAIKISFNPILFAIVIGVLPALVFFGYYNKELTGSPTLIGQTIGRTDFKEKKIEQPTAKNREDDIYKEKVPFNTRKQMQGIYVLLLSNERSWLFYSPIVLWGLFGAYIGYKKQEKKGVVITILSIAALTVLLYSLFGDPWGGWSFGARYLIPAAAMLTLFTGFVWQKYYKNLIIIPLLFLTLIYSYFVSILGALTTNLIPPQVEAINLATPLPYTYEYNMQFITVNKSSSLIYNVLLNNSISVFSLLIFLSTLAAIGSIAVYFFGVLQIRKEHGK